jgi:hypothetical protein
MEESWQEAATSWATGEREKPGAINSVKLRSEELELRPLRRRHWQTGAETS